MARNGVFIVLEGTDGSGKGTQFKLLTEHLRGLGYDVATFDFPQYDKPSSHFVKRYLNGDYGTADEIGPYTASLFYALDRYEAAPAIRQALEQGKVVLANRFTGSNMGHQGTKFAHAEERRGYFIWLDNLEFEMLKIPRPDASFVLRVPAEIAQQLVDQKGERSYTDKKRDLHEADLSHLQRAVAVYDDLCQLFPKDFQRIDCVRGDELLSIETVQELVRQKLEPYLPVVPEKPAQTATEAAGQENNAVTAANGDHQTLISNEFTQAAEKDKELAEKFGKNTASQLTVRHIAMNASSLLAQKLEQGSLTTFLRRSANTDSDHKDANGAYKYYIPEDLSVDLKTAYCAHMDEIFRLQGGIVQGLINYLADASDTPAAERDEAWQEAIQAQARDAAQATLPVATTSAVDMFVTGQALENLTTRLLSDVTSEARKAGENLLAQARTANRAFLENIDKPERTDSTATYRISTNAAVKKLAGDYLSDNHATETDPVQLVNVWPRNEFDLVPDMLYEHSNLPLRQIQEEVAAWPYEKRLGIFEAYIGERVVRSQRPGRALEKAHYSWDILCDFNTSRELQRHRIVEDLESQELTPRYGYDMPKLIEDAGLEETFQTCFDISLTLHSLLQASGYALDAQYATLMGHKLRWKVTYNAREAFRLHEEFSQQNPATRQLLQTMHEKLSEAHPLLGESMKFANQDERQAHTKLPNPTAQS